MVIMDPGSSCPWPGPSGGARGDGGGGPCPRCGSTSRVCQRQTSASSPPKGMEPLTPGTFPLQTGFFLGTAGRDHHRLLGPWARRRLAKWRRARPPLWQYFVCVCVCVCVEPEPGERDRDRGQRAPGLVVGSKGRGVALPDPRLRNPRIWPQRNQPCHRRQQLGPRLGRPC
jgi:hypothetical protein